MPVIIEPSAPTELSLADLQPRGEVYPSPLSWRDQVLYFLMPDRFSDGGEAQRPLFDRGDSERCKAADKGAWMAAGKTFQGGTLKGIEGKLDYLKELGITALWIGPVWRQRPDLDTYHGYGIQNFLDVDPRFGTRQDLRDLVDAAHARKMYVLLDVIYNHYLRETSFLNHPFSIPGRSEVIAWARLFHHQEVLVALNSHDTEGRGTHVTVDAALHPLGSAMTLLYHGAWSDEQLRQPPQGHTVFVEHSRGRATVRLNLPLAGIAILA